MIIQVVHDMKKRKNLSRILSLAIVLSLCLALSAPCAVAEDDSGVLDSELLTKMVEDAISKHHAQTDYVSVCCYYINTGDTWYYNADHWYFPASLYKVPLMMLLTERIGKGELSEENKIDGAKVSALADKILLLSNNEAADTVLRYLGGNEKCLTEYKKFSSMTEDEYDRSYLRGGNFNVRFMNEIMKTLYSEPDRFPGMLDRMLQAQPDQYLKKELGDTYPIAQKYGSYDRLIHASGIIYTPNPIIITIMTEYLPSRDALIGDLAKEICDYCMTIVPPVETASPESTEPVASSAPGQGSAETAQPEMQPPELLPVEEGRGTSIPMFLLSIALIALVAGGIYYYRKKAGERRHHHHHKSQ